MTPNQIPAATSASATSNVASTLSFTLAILKNLPRLAVINSAYLSPRAYHSTRYQEQHNKNDDNSGEGPSSLATTATPFNGLLMRKNPEFHYYRVQAATGTAKHATMQRIYPFQK